MVAIDYVNKVAAHQETRLWEHMAGEVLDWLPDLEGKRVLDWGCGPGKMSRKLHEMGATVTGVDPDRYMIQAAMYHETPPGLKFSAMSPFDLVERYYDVVVAMNVLGHTPDPFVTMQRMQRVLKPYGIMVILNPNVWHWIVRAPSNLLKGYKSDPTIKHRFTRDRMMGWAMGLDLSLEDTKYLGERYLGVPSMHLTRLIYSPGIFD